MKKFLAILLVVTCSLTAQAQFIQQQLKFATFYTAVTGNNSLADVSVYSINPSTGILDKETISTPFDYTFAFGVRKIARLDYENRKNDFGAGPTPGSGNRTGSPARSG